MGTEVSLTRRGRHGFCEPCQRWVGAVNQAQADEADRYELVRHGGGVAAAATRPRTCCPGSGTVVTGTLLPSDDQQLVPAP